MFLPHHPPHHPGLHRLADRGAVKSVHPLLIRKKSHRLSRLPHLGKAHLATAFIDVLLVLHREGSLSDRARTPEDYVTYIYDDPDIEITYTTGLAVSCHHCHHRKQSQERIPATASRRFRGLLSNHRTTVWFEANGLSEELFNFQASQDRWTNYCFSQGGKKWRSRRWEGDLIGLGRAGNGELACSS